MKLGIVTKLLGAKSRTSKENTFRDARKQYLEKNNGIGIILILIPIAPFHQNQASDTAF